MLHLFKIISKQNVTNLLDEKNESDYEVKHATVDE